MFRVYKDTTKNSLSTNSLDSSVSLNLPVVDLADADLDNGSLFVSGNGLYLGTGSSATKIATASASGVIRLEDADGDTYVQVDNGSDNDRIVLKTPATGSLFGTIGSSGVSLSTTGLMALSTDSTSASAISLQISGSSGGVTMNTGTNGIRLGVVGDVTQTGSIASGVTVNATSGVITTVNTTLAAGSGAQIVVTNNRATTSSKIFVSIVDYTGTSVTGYPFVYADNRSAGQFTIQLVNRHPTVALGGILKIAYLILR